MVFAPCRYGKPMVLDLMDTNLWDEVRAAFDAIEAGLLDRILTKEILKNHSYLQLVREEDGDQYTESCFQSERLAAFTFIVLTAVRTPCESMLDALCVQQVEIDM